MTLPPAPQAHGQAFFRPGGFSLYEGESVEDRERLLRLTGVFVATLLRGWLPRLGAFAFLLPAVGIGIYALIRTQVAQFAVPPAEQTGFLLGNLTLLFSLNLGWLLLGHAGLVAPLIARDASNGALLLYFSRPVVRSHYLLARLLAVAGTGAMLLALPGLLVLGVHLASFGPQLGGSPLQGWSAIFLWLGAALAVLLASAIGATLAGVVALCAGVLVRNPASAPLLFGGGVLGSVAVSWVLQLAWGRETAARSLDLHHALSSFATLALAPLQPEAMPRFVLLDAALGAALWAGLGLAGWLLLQRFIADPPLGRGRT